MFMRTDDIVVFELDVLKYVFNLTKPMGVMLPSFRMDGSYF